MLRGLAFVMPGGAHENMRGWSPEEDEMLLELIQVSGKRWKYIAEALGSQSPGTSRTPAMVRNRFLRIERGRWLTEQGKSKNRCGQCGQLKRGHVCQAPRALVSTSLQAQEARHEAARLRYGDAFAASPALAIECIEPTAPAPPMLRTQDSMEILARACETQPLAADGGLEQTFGVELRADGSLVDSSTHLIDGSLIPLSDPHSLPLVEPYGSEALPYVFDPSKVSISHAHGNVLAASSVMVEGSSNTHSAVQVPSVVGSPEDGF